MIKLKMNEFLQNLKNIFQKRLNIRTFFTQLWFAFSWNPGCAPLVESMEKE